jgi:methionyl-tRNA formyltransferase
MKIVFIGSIEFSKNFLLKLISINANIVAVCTLKKSLFNSDHFDLSDISKKYKIPFKYTSNINSKENITWIQGKAPDLIFCFGWSRLLSKDLLKIPKYGSVGYHPASLPQNRGRHPIVWALVLGLKSTASTFFYMNEGVDNGDIISQIKVNINENDNAKSLYEKINKVALDQLELFVPQMEKKQFSRIKQDESKVNYWRKRRKEDGRIDWRMSSKSIHNLVRALTHPYVGAHTDFKDKEVKIWATEIVKCKRNNIEPGKIIKVNNNTILVKAGDDLINILDSETFKDIKVGDYL